MLPSESPLTIKSDFQEMQVTVPMLASAGIFVPSLIIRPVLDREGRAHPHCERGVGQAGEEGGQAQGGGWQGLQAEEEQSPISGEKGCLSL